ncbi:hypothetical protein FACS1894186_6790 [Alphaproteobacteria bacterium]|nr:hypothetical protein FACS1894186_6790 [Alphaproteobacteria bacterium]
MAALREEIEQTRALRDALDLKQAEIARAAEVLAGEQEGLNKMIAAKAGQQRQLSAASKAASSRARELAKSASDVKDLMVKLEKARKAAAATAPKPVATSAKPAPTFAFAKAKGQISPPATGAIVKEFGEKEAGTTAKGLTFAAREGSKVLSPFDGTVLFADSFRGYGLLAIIEHEGGYHSLLAGMSALDVHAGDHVLAGEPVGTAAAPTSGHGVYFELRQRGTPINPKPWLTSG